MSQIANSKYPNPQDKRYKYNPFKQIEKDYIFASGGTFLLKEFLSIMGQQEDIINNLMQKSGEDNPSYEL